MKKNNPHTPIMLREALGVEPKVFARYGRPITPLGSEQRRLMVFNRAWQGEARVLSRYIVAVIINI